MNIIRNLDQLPDELRGGAVTIGNFDGVHRGHAQLIARLKQLADQTGGPALVFTFDPHPVRLLRPDETPPPLTWTDRKAALLGELGVSAMVAYPTDSSLLSMTYQQFFQQIIREHLQAKAVVEGPNFYFGKGRQGDVAAMDRLCRSAAVVFEVVQPLESEGAFISSSRIRQLIGKGDVETAARFLTHPYRIRGMVTHGAGRGAKLGFPTANVAAIDTLIPAAGVYAGRAYCEDLATAAAIHVGPNPTFGENVLKVEVHLLGVDRSLYGCPLEIDFYQKLRGVQLFESVDQLKLQLKQDLVDVNHVVSSFSK